MRSLRGVMKLDIINCIVHQVYLDPEMQLGLRLSREVLPNEEEVVNLLTKLNQVYNAKPARSVAQFLAIDTAAHETVLRNENKPTELSFDQLLNQWLASELDYLAFSQAVARLLKNQYVEAGVVEHGFLLLAEYKQTAVDYLLISYIPVREGMMVQADLSVQRATQLDLSKIQLAAKINLTEYQSASESFDYLSFIRGRSGSKAIDAFLSFLNCEEKINSKKSTEHLIHAIQGVVHEADLEPDTAEEVRQVAYDYCEDQWRKGEQIAIQALETQLKEKGDVSLQEHLKAKEIELPEAFPADKTALRRLVRFQGQGGGVSVGFDQKELGSRVQYDPDKDTLTIVGTPPNLREQLRRYFGLND